MKAKALALAFIIIVPHVCWGQAPLQNAAPQNEAQPRHPPQSGDTRTDVFGRPIFTDMIRSDYANRFFSFPQFEPGVTEGFHLLGALKEEYSSNLNLTADNRKDDLITTVSPGLRYVKTDSTAGMDVNYLLGYNVYAKNSELDYLSHLGTLNAFYRPDPRWTLNFREYIIRTDDPLEFDPLGSMDQYFLSTSMERTPHLRNVAEPQIDYRFGPQNYLSLLYRNMYYSNSDPNISRGTENTVNPRIMYWFNVHNGVVLDYSYTVADLNNSPNWNGNSVRTRYIYRLNPIASFFAEYLYENRNFDPPSINYRVHSPTIGADYAFSPSFNGSIQVGYFIRDPVSGSSESSFSANVYLRKRSELTTYNLILIWGFREEFLVPGNPGFIEYKRAEMIITRALSPRLNYSLTGVVEKTDYVTDRNDWIYGAYTGLSWNILKWLAVIPSVGYRVRDSNTEPFDYKEFHGILRITAVY